MKRSKDYPDTRFDATTVRALLQRLGEERTVEYCSLERPDGESFSHEIRNSSPR